MKKSIFTGVALVLGVLTLSFKNLSLEEEAYPVLKIGDAAPKAEVKMKEVNGNEYSLNDLKKENGLLVVFSCNSCPFVVGNGETSEGWEARYNQLNDVATRAKIGMVLVNSNEAKREGDDSFDKMKERAIEKEYKSYYVMDKNSELANAFGAKTTPHVFLFDKDMKLVYKGAIDDNVKNAKEVKEEYLKAAIRELILGNKISTPETKASGCSIKRVNK